MSSEVALWLDPPSLRDRQRVRAQAPDRLELIDELPLTSMHKVDKRALVARTTEGK